MTAWPFAILLVLAGNLLHLLIGSTAVLPGGSWHFVGAGAALIALALAVARSLGLRTASLGLRARGAVRGAVLGALVGYSLGLAAVLALGVAAAIVGSPIEYGPLSRVSRDELVPHVLVFLPLGAVIPEEVAFRGALLAAFLRGFDTRSATAFSAAAFALWHATVAVATVYSTTMPVLLVIPAIVGAFTILFAGGVIMAALRLITSNLAAPIAAHWAFNAIVLVGLWSSQRTPA